MRILVLAQYYDPVPVPKPSEVARWLASRGHEISVLTGLPNYPSGVLATGYRQVPYMHEVIDGILVRRVYELPYHGTSARGRMVNYASFMIAASIAGYFVRKPEAVYVWHPPLTVGVVSSLLFRLRGIPFVYDVQDIWPDSALMSGMLSEGKIAAILRRIERWVYRHAAHILVVTDGARANLIAKGVSPEKISVLSHWFEPGLLEAPPTVARTWAREFLRRDGLFIVTFAGNLGLLQGLDSLLEAAEQLSSSPEISFRIVGDGADRKRLEDKSRQMRLTNVEFLGARPPTDMPAIFAESDALLVQVRSGSLNDLIVPSKTQAYLAAGRPIVAALSGAAAQIIIDANAGVVVPPDDPARLADAVVRLSRLPPEQLRAMGERGRSYAAKHFSKELLMTRIESLLQDAARHAAP